MKNSLTDSQLVNEWSGTTAQLKCNISLAEVVNADNIPSLSDVNAAFNNATSVRIITRHLQSVLQFSGVELTDAQLAETSLAILANYWFLNLAELCIFFVQLKAGSRGQFVWGNKINNQALMVALSEFCKDRRIQIERLETDKMKEQKELYHSRIETAAASIIAGLDKVHILQESAKKDIASFRQLYPYLPENHSPETWWKAWLGEMDALKIIYGKNIPPVDVAVKDIGRYLCNYTTKAIKDDEKI